MTGVGSGGNNSVSLSSSTSTYHTSSLPPSKPPASLSSSSYQSGTKFHSSSAVSSIEHVKGASSSLSSAQDQDTTVAIEPSSTSSSSTPSFTRHRIHRRTKDQDTKVATGNNHSLPAIKESLPANGGNGSNSNCGGSRSSGVQFDLEAAAFPPLPGLDPDHGKASIDVGTGGNVSAVGMESSSQNRLSDVVKGTAKLKAVVKDKENGNQSPQLQQQQQQQQQQSAAPVPAANTASRSASPGASIGIEAQGNAVISTNSANATHILNPPTVNNENTSPADAAALSTVALTPPSSPDK